jgi:hypothetical protein
MNHSTKSDEWIAAVISANPIRIAPNGNILTCPLRLHYTNLLEPAKPMRGEDPNKPTKYGATLLFPPGSEGQFQSVIRPVLLGVAKAQFPDKFDPATGEVSGLTFPFRDQGEKAEHQGFTRGCGFANATTKFKPMVVDTAYDVIPDEVLKTRSYDGVWAICELNAYAYNDPRKKGVSLGLQMVMLFADDQKLMSAKADPRKVFAGVKIDSAFNPSAAFGTGPATQGRPTHNPDALLPAQPVGGTGAAAAGMW